MLIFLDLDDVLNDFTIFALKWYGIDIEYKDIDPADGRDIVKTARNHGFQGDFWAGLPQSVWRDCPKSGLFGHIDGDFILTAPQTEPSCVAGKMEWINRHWGKEFIFAVNKGLLSRPGRLLVDDCEDNIKAWETYGGAGILVPRPWNKNRDKDMVEYVKGRIDEL